MKKYCPQCGTMVSDDLPGGLCPTCLMQAARQSQRDVDATNGMPSSLAAPTSDHLAQLFPELEINEMLGQGGMGAVYRAKQKNLDRPVALKIFLYQPSDPHFTERFAREARALAKLNHPNIVTVHDFGQRDKYYYLIMELVDGVNLRQLTIDQKLDSAQAIQLVPQLCDALQFAHDNGVIHRDIKPENILLDQQGRLKIADFGLAKMTGSGNNTSLTRTQQVMGTLNYMAPEQRERPLEVDHRADIYSLGVVIYEMLTGELPLGRFQPPSKKVQVDVRLDEVVMRALEKEPHLRYQQVSEFKTGFASVSDAGSGEASFFTAAPTPAKPVKSTLGVRGKATKRQRFFLMIYNMIALMICFGAGLVFIMGSDNVELIPEDESRLAGIMVAMAGGFLFAISGFVRFLMGIAPDKDDEDNIEYHRTATKTGTVVRIIAMFFCFASGATFVIRSFDVGDDRVLMLIGIILAFIGAAGFIFSGNVETFLNEEDE